MQPKESLGLELPPCFAAGCVSGPCWEVPKNWGKMGCNQELGSYQGRWGAVLLLLGTRHIKCFLHKASQRLAALPMFAFSGYPHAWRFYQGW